ncbi:MAG TPA: hypothetical protein VIH31_03105 [Candidatus Paceibacterota bacterium]
MKSSGEYFLRKIEKRGEFKKSIERLEQPFTTVEYKDQDQVSLEKGKLNLSFNYQDLPKHLLINKIKDIEQLEKKDQRIVEMMRFKPQSFKELTDYSLKNSQDKIDLFNLLPAGYKVYFSSTGDQLISAVDLKNGILLINEFKINPKTILTIFHETGHVLKYGKMNDQNQRDFLKANRDFKMSSDLYGSNAFKLTKDDLSVVLKSERDAWAFTLKTLKPFFKDMEIEMQDLKAFVHDFALQTYSEEIHNIIEKGLIEEIK